MCINLRTTTVIFIFIQIVRVTSSINNRVPSSRNNVQKRGYTVPYITDVNELEALKAMPNGSMVLYFRSPDSLSKEFEANLIRSYNHLSKYKIRFKKINCAKFKKSVDDCRSISNQILHLYKKGAKKLFYDYELDGTDRTVNEILFFLTTVHFDKMVIAGNMNEADEILQMNYKIFNTVVGSFKDYGSESLRHFLEAAMEQGSEFSFVLVDEKSVASDELVKRDFFIRFYHTMDSTGPHIKSTDLSGSAGSTKTLIVTIQGVEIGLEMKESQLKMTNAQKAHKQHKAELTEKATQEWAERHSLEELKQIEDAAILMMNKGKPGLLDERMSPQSILKDQDGEIDYAAYISYERENRLLFRKTDYLLNETELLMAIDKVNNTRARIVVVLFYVPWDPIFQVFQLTYYKLALGLKSDKKVRAVLFNCWAWPDQCSRYNIITYPKIVLFKPLMAPFIYNDFLHYETLKRHIKLWKEPFLPVLNEERQLQQIAEQMKDLFVFGVFRNQSQNGELRSNFERLALLFYGKVYIGTFITKKLKIQLFDEEIKPPCIIAINANGVRKSISETDHFDEEDIVLWFEQQRQLLVEELTTITFPRMYKIKKPFLISFHNKEKSLSSLTKFAKRNKEILTVWMDIMNPLTKDIQQKYRLQNKETIVLLDKTNNKVFEYTKGKKTIANITKWVKVCLTNVSLTPTYSLKNTSWPGKEGYNFLKMIDENRGKTRKEKLETKNATNKTKEAQLGSLRSVMIHLSAAMKKKAEAEEIEEEAAMDTPNRLYDEL